MNAFLILALLVVVLLAMALKIAILMAVARWIANRVPDEPDYSESVIESRH